MQPEETVRFGKDHSISISAHKTAGYLVELKYRGATIDRYTTHDLTIPRKDKRPWIKICTQVSAAIQIAIPTIPGRSETQQEKLTRIENAYLALLMSEQRRIAELEMQREHDAQFPSTKVMAAGAGASH